VETPLPSNSPHGHMILRVDLVGSHGRWKRPCLQTTPERPRDAIPVLCYTHTEGRVVGRAVQDAASLCVAALSSGENGAIWMGCDNNTLTKAELMQAMYDSQKYGQCSLLARCRGPWGRASEERVITLLAL
jgi:hypothetical protein